MKCKYWSEIVDKFINHYITDYEEIFFYLSGTNIKLLVHVLWIRKIAL